ncbi:MAG: hypothetical protein RL259_1412 [Bacteroidota bacterium]|jgi:four helix bundle protein
MQVIMKNNIRDSGIVKRDSGIVNWKPRAVIRLTNHELQLYRNFNPPIKMKDHKDLDVWKYSMLLAEQIYGLTKDFPLDEKFGLVAQMKRSAVSVPSNIAEGAVRKGKKEFIQFLYIAMGSLSELETQLYLSYRLQFMDSIDELITLIEKIKQLLFGLIRYISNRKS